MFARVVTSAKSSAIGNGLWYETHEPVSEGDLLKVPLRAKLVESIVVETRDARPSEVSEVKDIAQILHRAFLPITAIETAKHLAEDCYCTLRQSLSLWMPSGVWSRTAKGIAELQVQQADVSTGLHLTETQKTVVQTIMSSRSPTLLFGVTGSGKTEVYLSLIEETLREGKTAIFLVPEIFLSQHLVERLTSVFPHELISVVHSKLSGATLKKAWKAVRNAEKRIVIGARSALFSPTPNLGLVILDEEHEWTYKNEQTPRYHARSVAEELCRQSGARLVLGSATPSVESWQKGKTGTYQVSRLTERYGNATLPKTTIVDLADASFGTVYPFTETLIEAVRKRLQRGEQTVLLLNRRGTATALLCLDCRRRITSPVSQLPFAVHYSGSKPFLYDHTTDTRLPLPEHCPHCKSLRLHEIGAGTQKVESIVRNLFPNARMLRADSDSLSTPEAMREVLEEMRSGKADILLGTQMVAKGIDLPGVTLAAVLVADIGLSLPHFRAGERVFQLLSQLTGRSGRHQPGEVIIQTFRPDAPEIRAAALHETEKFLEEELKLRAALRYPPAIPMMRFLFRGSSPANTAKSFAGELQVNAAHIDRLANISCGPTFFSGGAVWQVFLRSTECQAIAASVSLEDLVVDNNPLETL